MRRIIACLLQIAGELMSEFLDSMKIWLPGTLVMLTLILCSGFFSASETAFFFLTRDQIRRFGQGNLRQRTVASLLGNPDRLLTAVLFWNLVINLGYFSVGIVVMQQLTAQSFHMVAACLAVFNLVGMIVLGEVLPKSLAVVFRQQISSLASLPLAVSVRILDPFIPALDRTARVLRRSFWPQVKHEAHLQAKDLEKAIDASAAFSSELMEMEQQVLHNILDLNEVDVEEVMRPRNLCLIVPLSETLQTANLPSLSTADYVLLRDPDSRLVQRAVSVSEINSADLPLGDLSEPVLYVPWCASLAFTLAELRNLFRSVAVVVDEHGTMVGMVTHEDLLETVFTDAPSRTRKLLRREPLIEISANRFHVEGLATLRYLSRHLRVNYVADDDTTTLAGLFHETLERMPRVGDSIRWEGWMFKAIEVSPRGQVRALVELEDYSAPDEGEDA